MLITQLKTFIGLAEFKNFTLTAQKLAMTQPGVSQHLKALEQYYNVTLAIRGKKSIELTTEGKQLVSHAKKIFTEMQEFRDTIGIDDPHAGVCRFASPGGFGIKMYSRLLELQKEYPNLVIHYEYRPNSLVVSELLSGEIDLGYVSKKPDQPEIESKMIDHERLCLIVPITHKDFSFSGLKQLGFINHPDGFHHAARLLEQNFSKEFSDMREIPIRGFVNQITRILEPVALKIGFTALPEAAVEAFVDRKKVQIVPLKKDIVDPIFAIKKKNKKLPQRFEFIEQQLHRQN